MLKRRGTTKSIINPTIEKQSFLRVSRKKEEKGDYIVDFILGMDECNESLLQLDCKKCCTSFHQTMFFSVPKTDTMRFSLLWETPQSIKERKDLKDLLGYYVRLMNNNVRSNLCCWGEEYVRTCVVLLCHAFHCPGVQCFMIYDSSAWGMEDSQKEKVIWDEKEQSRDSDEPVDLI
jgi:hypothetical protein